MHRSELLSSHLISPNNGSESVVVSVSILSTVIQFCFRAFRFVSDSYLHETNRAVRHPNVVNYMGTIHHGGDVYLITEYMEGGTLWKLLNNKAKPLPWLTRVNIAIDVARAITYLHARNIIHRDLKCRNLLVRLPTRLCRCDSTNTHFCFFLQTRLIETFVSKVRFIGVMGPEFSTRF